MQKMAAKSGEAELACRMASLLREAQHRDPYDVVVAIDFGTSFSGFAFSFNHRDGSEDIYMNREWGSAQGYKTLKTPTCILLNPQKKFVRFGFEAAEKYAELEETNDKTFYFFDRFKMMLYGSEVSLGSLECLFNSHPRWLVLIISHKTEHYKCFNIHHSSP